MPTPLEIEFHRAMINIFTRAKIEADYLATRYIQMVTELGGVKAAKKLINSDKPSEGYTALWKRKRLDITVEALVQNPKWAPLFDPSEIERAKQRLKEYGHEIS
jgi:hypothetical protein